MCTKRVPDAAAVSQTVATTDLLVVFVKRHARRVRGNASLATAMSQRQKRVAEAGARAGVATETRVTVMRRL